MHASEMADGNYWQKKIAKLAIEKLGPIDMVGMLALRLGNAQAGTSRSRTVGDRPRRSCGQVDRMTPGDMPDFDPSLQMAYDALTNRRTTWRPSTSSSSATATRADRPAAAGRQMQADKVTVHDRRRRHARRRRGPAKMSSIADDDRRHGSTTSPIPRRCRRIYIKETRLVSQSFIYEQARSSRSWSLPQRADRRAAGDLPPLYGFVRTTPQGRSPLVEMPIDGAAARRPGVPDPGVLALRPGQVGGVHQRRPQPAGAGRPGTATGRVGHVRQVLGAGGRLVAAAVETRQAEHDRPSTATARCRSWSMRRDKDEQVPLTDLQLSGRRHVARSEGRRARAAS